jgi:cytochrome c556
MKPALTFLTIVSLGLAGCAATDDTPGGKAAQERHERFEELGEAFKKLNDQLKSGTPNFAEIKGDAAKISALAPQIKDWFPAGSGPQDGKRTDAKAEVWTRPAEFQQAAARFGDTVNALNATIATGDTTAIAASARTMGGACKNCHDKFRKD